jgi:hypothetical protein
LLAGRLLRWQSKTAPLAAPMILPASLDHARLGLSSMSRPSQQHATVPSVALWTGSPARRCDAPQCERWRSSLSCQTCWAFASRRRWSSVGSSSAIFGPPSGLQTQRCCGPGWLGLAIWSGLIRRSDRQSPRARGGAAAGIFGRVSGRVRTSALEDARS